MIILNVLKKPMTIILGNPYKNGDYDLIKNVITNLYHNMIKNGKIEKPPFYDDYN